MGEIIYVVTQSVYDGNDVVAVYRDEDMAKLLASGLPEGQCIALEMDLYRDKLEAGMCPWSVEIDPVTEHVFGVGYSPVFKLSESKAIGRYSDRLHSVSCWARSRKQAIEEAKNIVRKYKESNQC